MKWRQFWVICFDLEFSWPTGRSIRYSTQWQARPDEARKNLDEAFLEYWWSCSGWAFELVVKEADRVYGAWEARKREIRRREEERRRRIEADRVRRVNQAREMRAAGRPLTQEQYNLLFEDAAIRQAQASEANANEARRSANAAEEAAREAARTRRAAEKAADLEEQRLREDRAYREEESERKQKAEKAAVAAAALGYVAARNIAKDAAEEVAKAIRESK